MSSPIQVISKVFFQGCKSLLWTAFEIGSRLSELEAEAFCDSGLTSIHLPASVTVIGASCFHRCGSLVSITFECGSQLSQLANGAFSRSGLTSIHLPASVTVIGEWCFYDCRSLVSIKFECYRDFGTSLSELANSEFYRSGLISIHLPASVTVIGDCCFHGCRSLASITCDPASPFRGSEPDLLAGVFRARNGVANYRELESANFDLEV
jgi:hypothetical protein